jgi:hypothetical protein
VLVLSDLSSFVFVGKDLSFALGSSTESGNFVFIAMHVGVSDFVTKEILLGSTVYKNDRFVSPNDFS